VGYCLSCLLALECLICRRRREESQTKTKTEIQIESRHLDFYHFNIMKVLHSDQRGRVTLPSPAKPMDSWMPEVVGPDQILLTRVKKPESEWILFRSVKYGEYTVNSYCRPGPPDPAFEYMLANLVLENALAAKRSGTGIKPKD